MARMRLNSTRRRTPGASTISGSGRVLHWLGIVAMIVGLFAPLFTTTDATATPMSLDRARMMAMQQPLDRDIAGFERIVVVGDFQLQFGCNAWDVNCDPTRLQNNGGFWTGVFAVPPGGWNWELIGVDFSGVQYSLATGQVNIAEGQAGFYAEYDTAAREDDVSAVTVLATVSGPFGTVALAEDNGGFVARSLNVDNDGPVDMQVTIAGTPVPVNTNLSAGSNRVEFDASGNVTRVESLGDGQVLITRTDASSVPAPGSCFVLDGNNDTRGCDVDDGVADGNTTLRFPTGFEPGTYQLRETTPPDGQEALDDQDVQLQEGDNVLQLQAEGAGTGDIVVLRQDPAGNPVGGACFEAVDATGQTVGSACDEDGDVPDDGRIGIFDVPAGNVTLRETRTPDGYEPAAETPATVVADQAVDVPVQSAAIEVVPQNGNLIVTRTDTNGVPIGGACFLLVDANGLTIAEQCDDDGDSATVFNGVPEGVYTLRETRTPDGNQAAPDTQVTIQPNIDNTVSVAGAVIEQPTAEPTLEPTAEPAPPTEAPTLEPTAEPALLPTEVPTLEPTVEPGIEPTAVPQPGNLVIYRTDSNGVPVGGACFAVVDATGATIGEQCDEDGLAADDGTTGIFNIPAGTYTLRETRTPEGNQPAAETQVVIQPGIDNEVTVSAGTIQQPLDIPTPTPTTAVEPTETPDVVVPPPAQGAALVVTFPYEEGQAQTCFELTTGGAIGLLDIPYACDNGDNDLDPAAGVIRVENLEAGQFFVDFYAGPDTLVQGDPRPVDLVSGETATVTYEAPAPALTSFSILTTDGTNPVGGACYQVDGSAPACDDGSGTLVVPGVQPGEHTITMTTAPEGYEVAPPQTVTVAEDGSTQVVFTVAASTVTLTVTTVDSETSEPVPGACYALNGEQQACDESASGQVVFENVEPQAQTLVMTEAPEGFEPAVEQTITPGETEVNVVVQAEATGTITVTIVDTQGGVVAGACVTVGEGEPVCDDDNDGSIVLADLALGTYPVRVASVPAGFEVPAEGRDVELTGTTANATFEVARTTTSFVIQTTDGTNPVGGACYIIDETGDPFCDEGRGTLTIPDVLPGEHTVTMTSAPNRYGLSDPVQQTINVAADGSTVATFTVTRATTSFTINVTDGTNPVGGACFVVDTFAEFCDDGSGSRAATVFPGEHTITVTSVPGGFEIPEPQTVDVAADGSTVVTFTLERSPVTLQVTTIDANTRESLPGACYTLDGGDPVCDTTDSGLVVFENVPPTDHQLVMSTAPDGYVAAVEQTVPAGTTSVEVPLQPQTGSLTVSIVGVNDAPITGGEVCISLDSGTQVCDDDNDGQFEFDGLALGEHSVTVTDLPDRFDLPADSQTVMVTADEPAAVRFQIMPTAPTTGGLDVRVRYSDDTAAEGVCVTITRSGGDTQESLCDGDEGDTNPDAGVIGFDDLAPGTYEVALTPGSEVARPLQTTVPVSATVEAGERASVTLTLPLAPETGSLTLVTTSGGSNVGGACFTVGSLVVCDNDGNDADGTTGVVLIEDLDPGPYQVRMSTVPATYETPADQSATIAAGETARLDFELVRIPEPGSIEVRTTNGDGEPLLNACYAVMQSGTRVASQCDGSPADGVVTFTNIPAGTYQLVQTQTPGGQYAAAPTQTVEVEAGQPTVVDIVMDLRPGRLTVVTADRGEPTLTLQNACYRLVGPVEFGPFCDADDGRVDGRVVFTNVPAGQYELRQTVATAGYDPAADRTVTITAGGSLQVTVLNDKVQPPARSGTLVVIPLDPNGNPVAGGCYQLFNGATPVTQRWCDNADNQPARITIPNVPVGAYTLHEQLAPSPDWQIAANVVVRIQNGQTTTVEVPHEFKTGTVVVQAVNTVGLPLQNACFTLSNAGSAERCTDASGQVTITDQAPGTRQLTQAKAPFGYKLNTTPREVVVRPGQTTVVRVVFENQPPPNTGTVQVQKFVCPAGDGGERTTFLGGAQGNNQLKQTAGCVPAVATFTLVAQDGSTASNATFKTTTEGRAQLTAVNGIYLLTETQPDMPGNSAARIRVGTGQMTTVIVINYVAPPKPAPVTINVEGYTCPPGFAGSSFVDFQNSCMASGQLTNQITVRAEGMDFRFKHVTGDTGLLGRTTFTDLPPGTYTIWAERPFNMPLNYLFCGADPANPTLKAVNGSVVTSQASGTTITCRVFQVPSLFDATHGAIQVQKYNCPINERQRGYDYKNECTRASESIPFEIQRVDPTSKNKTPIGEKVRVVINADGIAQFPMLEPGTYKLTEVDGQWCFAQSNSVDSQGDVIVTANKLSEVWIYNCVGTSAPPNTGSGDAAGLLNPTPELGPMQVLPNLMWPTVLLGGWMFIRRQRHQA